MAAILIIIAIVVVIICVFALTQMNQKEDREEQSKKDREINNAEAIRKYKELFEDGIISQEEFETKKQELLNNTY